MPTALIADDEALLAEYLQAQLALLWPELSVMGIAANGLEALRLIDETSPDVVFLDIKMPGLNGLEVARRLDPKTRVVFVTAYDQFAVEAFEREAVDYVLKPIGDARLAKTVARLKQQIAAQSLPPQLNQVLRQLADSLPVKGSYLRWIRASVGAAVRQFPVDAVFYFQAQDKYTSVITSEGEALIRTGIAELAQQLDPAFFWQIHRGTIVNVAHIAATQRDLRGRTVIKLAGRPETLVASRAYAHLFRQM